MKNYYTAYVQHMIAFWQKTRGLRPSRFWSIVDQNNWEAVDTAVKNADHKLNPKDIDIALCVSSTFGFVKEKVDLYSRKSGIPTDTIWDALRAFERRIAQLRGLVAE